jgi:hypothetical protein
MGRPDLCFAFNVEVSSWGLPTIFIQENMI